jgi:hypothetical protein
MTGATPPGVRSRRLATLLLAAAVLSVLSWDLLARRQLGTMAGLTDEWIMLGANLAVHGTLGLGDEPWLLRPPGYPAFIAVPLYLAGAPRVVTMAYLDRAQGLVFALQALALTATAVLTYLWLARSLRPATAVAAAVTLALNPASVVGVGLLQYGTLHVACIVGGLWLLERALASWPAHRAPTAVAGAFWGLVTLVRPVSLVLPPFVLAAYLWSGARETRRRAIGATLLFTLSAAAVIAPWTARNYAVSGRFVLVNLQGWANLWAATLRPLPSDTESYRWSTFGPDILRIQERVTGKAEYDLLTYVRFNVEIEAAYRREALANLRRQPGVFATNAMRTVATLATGTSTVALAVFRLVQRPGVVPRPEWFNPPLSRHLGSDGLRTGFRLLVAALSALAAVGALLGLRRRVGVAWVTSVVAGGLLAAHALAHLEFTYLYVKMPFVVVLGFLAVDRIPGRMPLPGGRRLDLAALAAWAIAVVSLTLTVVLLRP